jgi:hypothetical protein
MLCTTLLSVTLAAGPSPKLFDAIRKVESNGNDQAIGDQGRSRGPYQIQRAYWIEGGGKDGDYLRLVWSRAACETVMRGYWKRYGARTDEQRARTHNGGPAGMKIMATAAYWQRVRKHLKGKR